MKTLERGRAGYWCYEEEMGKMRKNITGERGQKAILRKRFGGETHNMKND